jgi:hypothetical protein
MPAVSKITYFFVGVLKAKGEKSVIRIRNPVVRIRGSGPASKRHGFEIMLITLHPAVSSVYFMKASCSPVVDELVRVFDDAIPLVKVKH